MDCGKGMPVFSARLTSLALVCFAAWALIGLVFGFLFTIPIFGIIAGIIAGAIYWYATNFAAEKFLLDLYGAKVLSRTTAHNTYEILDDLSAKAGIEPPMLYVMPLHAPNAFVIARRERSAVIVLTSGLTQQLNRVEVRAVLALMVARIAQGDVVTWTTAAAMTSVPIQGATQAGINAVWGQTLRIDPETGLTPIGQKLLSAVMSPCLLVMRLSFESHALLRADEYAARLSSDPEALESALRKINQTLPDTARGYSGYNPGTAVLFAVPPVVPQHLISASDPSYLRAQRELPYHQPSLEERIKRLNLSKTDPVTV